MTTTLFQPSHAGGRYSLSVVLKSTPSKRHCNRDSFKKNRAFPKHDPVFSEIVLDRSTRHVHIRVLINTEQILGIRQNIFPFINLANLRPQNKVSSTVTLITLTFAFAVTNSKPASCMQPYTTYQL